MTDTINPLSRIARQLTPRRLFPAALALLIADLTITIALGGMAFEAHPIAAWSATTLGWQATGLVSVVLIGAWYAYLAHRGDETARMAALAGLTVLLAPVGWNLHVFAQLGWPSIHWPYVGETIAPVVAVTAVVAVAAALRWRDVSIPGTRKQRRAVGLSMIMVTSIPVGVAFADSSTHSGANNSLAQSSDTETAIDAYVIDSQDNSDQLKGFSFEEGTKWSNDYSDLYGLRAGPSNSVYTSDYANGNVDKYTPDGSREWSSSTNAQPRGLEYDSENGLVYAADHYGDSSTKLSKVLYADSGGDAGDIDTGSDAADWAAAGDYVFAAATSYLERYDRGATSGSYGDNVKMDEWAKLVTGGPNHLYVSGFGNSGDIQVRDPGTFDIVTTVSPSSGIDDIIQQDGSLYASHDGTVWKYDVDSNGNLDLKWEYSKLPQKATYIGVNPDGSVISGAGSELHAISSSGSHITSSDGYNSISGVASAGASAPSSPVTVHATDKDNNPASNATVQATVVDQDALDASPIDDTADQLLDEAENPEPPEYNEHLNLETEFDAADTTYVSVHPESQMSTIEAATGGLDPDVHVASGEEIYLMAWDATDDPGLLSSDLINRQLPGSPTDATIVIEQLDHRGDVTNRRTLDTEDPDALADIGFVSILDDYSDTHASTRLPDGFYRVSTEDSDFEYVIAVGDPASIIESELRDEADSLTDHAEWVRQKKQDDIFVTVTGETNSTGYADLEIPSAASKIQIQAYKGPDPSTVNADTAADITVQDIRDARDAGYDDAIYLSTEPTRVDMSETDGSETVEVRKLGGVPMEDVESWDDLIDQLREEFLDESTAQLEAFFRDEFDVGADELQNRHETLKGIIESNPDLEDRTEEILDSELSDSEDATEDQLQEELDAMQRALADTEEQLEADEPETDIDRDGELFARFPFSDGLDSDAVGVVIHWEDGTSDSIDGEHWHVQSASVLGGDEVVLDDYPVPDDRAVADIEVTGVSENGDLGSSRASVVNPAFDGDVPEIDAIDVSTLRPGTGETVSVHVRSDDEAYGSMEDLTVYTMDGTEVSTSADDGVMRFTPDEEGVHALRVTYSNAAGDQFTESVRIRAKSNPTSDPATVRISDGIGGDLAVAGDGLESASIDTDGDDVEITAQAPADETPNKVDVRAGAIAADTYTVRVVSGSQRENVNRHVNVRLRSTFDTEETLVYRAGKPITADGDTRYGEWETRENDDGDTTQVISTYTDASGEVDIETNRNPSFLDRVRFQIAVTSPFDLPFVMFSPLDVGAVDLPSPSTTLAAPQAAAATPQGAIA